MDLRSVLSGVSIPNSDTVSPADIHPNANLSAADLEKADLSDADLCSADLSNADLSRIELNFLPAFPM